MLRAIWRRAVVRDDWIALSETNNVSDEVLLADLKGTALYTVLAEVLGEEGNRSAYVDVTDLTAELDRMDAAEQAREGTSEERRLLEARMADAPDHFVSLMFIRLLSLSSVWLLTALASYEKTTFRIGALELFF